MSKGTWSMDRNDKKREQKDGVSEQLRHIESNVNKQKRTSGVMASLLKEVENDTNGY